MPGIIPVVEPTLGHVCTKDPRRTFVNDSVSSDPCEC